MLYGDSTFYLVFQYLLKRNVGYMLFLHFYYISYHHEDVLAKPEGSPFDIYDGSKIFVVWIQFFMLHSIHGNFHLFMQHSFYLASFDYISVRNVFESKCHCKKIIDFLQLFSLLFG